MKQVNRRMKGTEKFWLEGGAGGHRPVESGSPERGRTRGSLLGETATVCWIGTATAGCLRLQQRNCTRRNLLIEERDPPRTTPSVRSRPVVRQSGEERR